MSPVEVSIPPAIFTNHKGIRYGIAGSVWIEVPEGTLSTSYQNTWSTSHVR